LNRHALSKPRHSDLTRALDARAGSAGVAADSEADLLADCEAVIGAIGRRLGVPVAGLARLATRILDKETEGRNK